MDPIKTSTDYVVVYKLRGQYTKRLSTISIKTRSKIVAKLLCYVYKKIRGEEMSECHEIITKYFKDWNVSYYRGYTIDSRNDSRITSYHKHGSSWHHNCPSFMEAINSINAHYHFKTLNPGFKDDFD